MISPEIRRDAVLPAALLGLLLATSLLRPLLPIDETRYAAVAWEMWLRGDFLVPHLNGQPYHHKPPLLFWLIHAGWALFGVNDWWPRLISPSFAAATMILTGLLGRRLWPGRPKVARMAPLILLASLLFTYFASALMFDAMLAFFVAAGFAGIVNAWQGGAGARGFGLLAVAMGGAMYAKGPVALIHLLPVALFAPWWMREQRPRWSRWYAGVLLATLGGAALILAWAIPAGIAGGEQYRDAIFWGQTAGRMVHSFAHRAPWWFYLAYLPLILAPWLLWTRWWRGIGEGLMQESGFRFVIFAALFCLAFFSIVSGKRLHYLLPEFALFALAVARSAADSEPRRGSLVVPALTLVAAGGAAIIAAPVLAMRLGGLDDVAVLAWGGALALASGAVLAACRPAMPVTDVRRVATATICAAAGHLLAFDIAMREPYGVHAMADRLAQFERDGRPLAFEGRYHGDWTFAGRLGRPLEEVPEGGIDGWLAAHPDGRAVVDYRDPAELPVDARIEYSQRYRGRFVAILAAR